MKKIIVFLLFMIGAKAECAKSLNDAISNSEIFEINLIMENNIYLHNKVSSNYYFHIDEQNDLMAIATQCPFTGGIAIYIARAMVQMFDETIVYDDINVCASAGYNMRQTKDQSVGLPFALSVVPNPAKDDATFTYTPNLENALLILNDNIGRQILSMKLNTSGSISLDLSAVDAGLYYVIMQSNLGTIQTKLVVLK